LCRRFIVDAVVAAASAGNQPVALVHRQFAFRGGQHHFLTDHPGALIGIAFIDQTSIEGFDQYAQYIVVFLFRLLFL
jgi:hypothetical protein